MGFVLRSRNGGAGGGEHFVVVVVGTQVYTWVARIQNASSTIWCSGFPVYVSRFGASAVRMLVKRFVSGGTEVVQLDSFFFFCLCSCKTSHNEKTKFLRTLMEVQVECRVW